MPTLTLRPNAAQYRGGGTPFGVAGNAAIAFNAPSDGNLVNSTITLGMSDSDSADAYDMRDAATGLAPNWNFKLLTHMQLEMFGQCDRAFPEMHSFVIKDTAISDYGEVQNGQVGYPLNVDGWANIASVAVNPPGTTTTWADKMRDFLLANSATAGISFLVYNHQGGTQTFFSDAIRLVVTYEDSTPRPLPVMEI